MKRMTKEQAERAVGATEPNELIDLETVVAITGKSAAQIQHMGADRFPVSIACDSKTRAPLWSKGHVLAYLASRSWPMVVANPSIATRH